MYRTIGLCRSLRFLECGEVNGDTIVGSLLDFDHRNAFQRNIVHNERHRYDRTEDKR